MSDDKNSYPADQWLGVIALALLLIAIVTVAGLEIGGNALGGPWSEVIPEWAIGLLAFPSTLISLLGVILIRQTLAETRRTADAAVATNQTAREIGEAQVRAYPSIEDISYGWSHGQLIPKVAVRNVGQSPALDVEVVVNITLMPERQNWIEFIVRIPFPDLASSTTPTIHSAMSNKQLPKGFAPPGAIQVMGRAVVYARDVFGNPIYSTTVRMIRFNSYLGRSFSLQDETTLELGGHGETRHFSTKIIEKYRQYTSSHRLAGQVWHPAD